jgi:uncharacterized DUF497 family protein
LPLILINLKDKNEVKSQNLTTPSPSLNTGGGLKTYFTWLKGVLLLLVVHTTRYDDQAEIIRIISARRPDNHERKRYENGY